ncbi:MAG: hypothetical protein AABX14_01115 [Candidatus Aenigmatarchaeota archaeon]
MEDERIISKLGNIEKEIEEIREDLDVFMESYIEMSHSVLEKDRSKFISLDKYGKKHGVRR